MVHFILEPIIPIDSMTIIIKQGSPFSYEKQLFACPYLPVWKAFTFGHPYDEPQAVTESNQHRR